MPTETAEHSTTTDAAKARGDGEPQAETPAAGEGAVRENGSAKVGEMDLPIMAPGQSYGSITDKISGIVLEKKHPKFIWWSVFLLGFLGTQVLIISLAYLVVKGVGIWGINVPVAWGFAIINFVWWIGIGHAGTLISAILYLFREDWRTSINRFAEAMTLFAVACAGLFPLFHMGRPWLFYYILPYPNTLWMWPQFRSPLTWDVFAVATYGTVSLFFWYMGLIPDLASMRDRAKSRFSRRIFGVFALGWRNSAKHWHRYQTAYLLMAGLATPLVISVHSIVGIDFAYAIVPGWHSTIFPPFFVAGAIFSGFAMVLTLVIPIRKLYGLEGMITMRHLDFAAKVLLATGLITSYGYVNETFFAWYSGSEFELYMIMNRMFGPYAFFYWLLIFCNVASIQTLWFPKLRHNLIFLWCLSIVVNVGMWLERFIIVVTSLHRDYQPSSWDMFVPTFWDWSTFLGTMGFFLMMMFIFIRCVPMISMTEMRELLHEKSSDHEGEEHEDDRPTASPYTHQETGS
jgi:molybdopterin-containing oxidoreductase family membrane subunit